MDWIKIKENQPKAFDKLIIWLDCSVEVKIEEGELVSYTPATPVHRHIVNKQTMPLQRLYDFFDGHSIRVIVNFDKEGVVEQDKWLFIVWQRDISWSNMGGDEAIYETRKDAEREGFEKAFDVLEKE